jgi:hypothetical protein
MAVSYGFYNSVNSDRLYDAVQMSSIFDGIIEDGVYMNVGDHMMVEINSGMDVQIGSGRAWFDHTWTLNDTYHILSLEHSEVALDRIDTIVLEVNSELSTRANSFKVLRGTPASTPVAPVLIDDEFIHQHPLAYISVRHGSTSILTSDITNAVGTSDCPFVTGVISSMNIDSLIARWESEWNQRLLSNLADQEAWTANQKTAFQQWANGVVGDYETWISNRQIAFDSWEGNRQDLFDDWFANIQAILSGDVVTNIMNEIDALKDKDVGHDGEITIIKERLDTDEADINDLKTVAATIPAINTRITTVENTLHGEINDIKDEISGTVNSRFRLDELAVANNMAVSDKQGFGLPNSGLFYDLMDGSTNTYSELKFDDGMFFSNAALANTDSTNLYLDDVNYNKLLPSDILENATRSTIGTITKNNGVITTVATTGQVAGDTFNSYRLNNVKQRYVVTANPETTYISGGDYNATSYPAAYAFDENNSTTYWLSSQLGAQVSGAAWIGVVLPTAKLITSIVFVPYGSTNYAVASATIQRSDNGSTWTDVSVLTGMTYNTTNRVVVNSGTGYTARYWRIIATSNTPSASWGITGFYLYTVTPVAMAGTTTTSIVLPNHGYTSANPPVIQNVTRTTYRKATVVNAYTLSVTAITSQVEGDTIRLFDAQGSFVSPKVSMLSLTPSYKSTSSSVADTFKINDEVTVACDNRTTSYTTTVRNVVGSNVFLDYYSTVYTPPLCVYKTMDKKAFNSYTVPVDTITSLPKPILDNRYDDVLYSIAVSSGTLTITKFVPGVTTAATVGSMTIPNTSYSLSYYEAAIDSTGIMRIITCGMTASSAYNVYQHSFSLLTLTGTSTSLATSSSYTFKEPAVAVSETGGYFSYGWIAQIAASSYSAYIYSSVNSTSYAIASSSYGMARLKLAIDTVGATHAT